MRRMVFAISSNSFAFTFAPTPSANIFAFSGAARNFFAGIFGLMPTFVRPSVTTNTSRVAFFLAPDLGFLKSLTPSCSAFPVAVAPPVYLKRVHELCYLLCLPQGIFWFDKILERNKVMDIIGGCLLDSRGILATMYMYITEIGNNAKRQKNKANMAK